MYGIYTMMTNYLSKQNQIDISIAEAELFGQISLLQSPRQETFWASAGFERTEESVMPTDMRNTTHFTQCSVKPHNITT